VSKDLFVRRVHGFLMLSHAFFLKLRRRCWRHKYSGGIISRDLSFSHKEIGFTKEVASF